MNVLKYRVSLDMFDTHSQTTIKAKKCDSACEIHITLTEKGKIYNIGEKCSATFNAKKTDGNFIYDKCTIEGNTIVYNFASSIDEDGNAQISACEGIVECEVTLYNATGEQLTSPRFTLFIDGTVYNGEDVISTPEADVLKKLIKEAKDIVEEMEEKAETIDGKEDKDNKVTSIDGGVDQNGNALTDEQYPSAKATFRCIKSKADKTELKNKEDKNFKVTSLMDEPPTHDYYPSAKAVYDKVSDAVGKVVEKFYEELETKADKSQIGDIETALDNKVDKEYANKNFANTIKNSAEGNTVLLNDVSPVEHTLDVSVSIAEGVKVTTYGKNLFNFDKSKSKCFSCVYATVVEKLDNGVIISGDGTGGNNQWTSGWYQPYKGEKNINMYFKSGQVVTISADYTFINTDNLKENRFGIYFNSAAADLTNSWKTLNVELGVKRRINQKYTIPADGYYSPGFTLNSCTIKIENIQVSLFSDTEFEEYRAGVECTPNADGTVSNVKSISPNMTILTDSTDCILTVGYNVDTKKYIDKKFAELQALLLEV